MSWRDAPLYIESYDLTRWLLERAESWPLEAPLRHRLVDAGCDLVEAVAVALTFPLERASSLQRADAAIVRIRVLLRLSRDLSMVSSRGVRFANDRLRAIGRMLGGWKKRVERSALPSVSSQSFEGAGHPASGA
ncbi:MAG: four helix bundle protein [Acidobacteriota bacterium]